MEGFAKSIQAGQAQLVRRYFLGSARLEWRSVTRQASGVHHTSLNMKSALTFRSLLRIRPDCR
jgi:hypothetical protein